MDEKIIGALTWPFLGLLLATTVWSLGAFASGAPLRPLRFLTLALMAAGGVGIATATWIDTSLMEKSALAVFSTSLVLMCAALALACAGALTMALRWRRRRTPE